MLCTPIDSQLEHKLDKLFSNEMEKCQKVLDRFIEIAKNQENFSEDISLDEEIKSFKQLL